MVAVRSWSAACGSFISCLAWARRSSAFTLSGSRVAARVESDRAPLPSPSLRRAAALLLYSTELSGARARA
ncbi:hypothetical protein V8C86DRAFT_2534448 [Haematococcus lacustris]